jgi:solute carrier family 44 protein 1 (choline transporter-like protein)
MGWDEQSRAPLLASKEQNTKIAPKESRGCNDILFLILFVACAVGMVIISSVAFAKGDPKALVPQWNPISDVMTQSWFTNAVAQAKQDQDALIISVGAAVLLGFAWIQMMKMFTTEFVYGTLVVGVLALAGLGGYVLNMGLQQKDNSISIVAYVMFGLDALLVLLIIFLRKKIALTCAMIKEACRGVQHNNMLFPVLSIVVALFLAFSAFWVAQFFYLWSIPDDSVVVQPGQLIKFNEKVRNLMIFQVFAFFWVVAFLSAVYQHVVAGSVAGWYFSRDVMGGRSRTTAFSSLFYAVTTSAGSLAFGSLVLAFVQFLTFLLELSKRSNTKNRVLVCLINGLQCILGCIQGIVQYINKFAYIHVAMHGYSFCKAAHECFDLISRNLFSAVIMDTITGFVLFVGKVLFAALSTIITIGILDAKDHPVTSVTLGLSLVLSFAVLHITSHVIGVSVDTVFVCYLEDLELNKGENMYISPDVHSMLQEAAAKHKDVGATA